MSVSRALPLPDVGIGYALLLTAAALAALILIGAGMTTAIW